LAIRVHYRDVFWLVKQVNITDLKIHAFFEKHQTAALREWAISARVQHHHKFISLKIYFNTTNAQTNATLNPLQL
jgi:hypothetical protein